MFLKIWNQIGKRRIIVFLLAFAASISIWAMPIRAVNVCIVVEYAQEYQDDSAQIFFNTGRGFVQEDSCAADIVEKKAEFLVNPEFFSCGEIRLDPGSRDEVYQLREIRIYSQVFKNKKTLLAKISAEELDTHGVLLGGGRKESEGFYAIQDDAMDASILFDGFLTGKFGKAVQNNWPVKACAQLGICVLCVVALAWLSRGKKAAGAAGAISGMVLLVCILAIYIFCGLPDKYYIHEEGQIQMPKGVASFETGKKNLEGISLEYDDMEALQEINKMQVSCKTGEKTYTKDITASSIPENGVVTILSDQFNTFSGDTLELEILYDGRKEEVPVAVNLLYRNELYQWLILLTFLWGAGMAVLAVFHKRLKLKAKWAVCGIYIMLFLFAVGKLWYYGAHIGQAPDEKAHVAYIAYLEDTGKVIPQFDEMRLFTKLEHPIIYQGGEEVYNFDSRLNYLGHPPAYYHIMRLAGGVKVNEDGSILADYGKLRGMSSALVLAAMVIWFYIGFQYLDKQHPLQHLLYGASLVCLPMTCFVGAGVNNDALTFLGGAVTAAGMLRFIKRKRDWKTYWLIAAGVAAMLLGKVTAGAMVVLAIWGYLLWELWTKRKPKEIFKKTFWPTVPVYLFIILYFILVYKQTGSIQPRYQSIDSEGYRLSGFYTEFGQRTVYSMMEYVKYFFSRFLYIWSGWDTSSFCIYKNTITDILIWLVPTTLWLVPLTLFRKKAAMDGGEKKFFQILYAAAIAVCMLQFKNAYNGFYFESGYLGGAQSRYYLCILGFLSYIWARVNILASETGQNVRKLVTALSLAAVIVLIYGDFIYFLIKNTTFYC